jgi:L-ribulose-5-phosphate 3-epimerase UlaE
MYVSVPELRASFARSVKAKKILGNLSLLVCFAIDTRSDQKRQHADSVKNKKARMVQDPRKYTSGCPSTCLCAMRSFPRAGENAGQRPRSPPDCL